MSTLVPRSRPAARRLPGLARLRGALAALLLTGLAAPPTWTQTPTPGLIFKPATAGTPGAAVLDPNGDGYVSAAGLGFNAADVGTQSEIPYRYVPQLVTNEPNADVRVGPNNKFTDFADVPSGERAVGFYADANNNYLFRFRLGGAAPNSKGYSIAIDTDGKFGFTGPNADPNAVPGNPGFELEILLASNFGVRLYNLDGTANPSDPGLDNVAGPDGSMIELPYASYAQKAIAITTNNGDLDVFYDFYIPLSVIQAQFGSRTFFNPAGTGALPFSLSTPLRMVANTIISPHTVTQYQNISDIGGVNDAQYSNPDLAFVGLITGATPVTGGGVGSVSGEAIPARTAPPVVQAPLRAGATTVRGTSTEAAGTVITVYVDGTALGTTTTVQADGSWTLTGVPALAANSVVKATATATGKTASEFSNEVPVVSTPDCATAAPSITCSSDRTIIGTATPGATVYLRYPNGNLVGLNDGTRPLLANTVTANSSGVFVFTGTGGNVNDCGNGQRQVLQGTYLVSYKTSSSGCEGAAATVCVGTATTTAAPVVTTALPITPATTGLSGTAPAGSGVALFIDGVLTSSTTAGSGGSFSFSGLSLTVGRVITLNATLNANACKSNDVTLNVVENRTVVPPVVTGPLAAGATTVTGTSVEAAGSTITLTVYANATGSGAATATYTTTVQAGGGWSVPVTALAAGSSVKATVTPANYGASGFSNVVPVQARTASAPVITGTYSEKGTSVTGTSAAPVGSVITVYIDGGDPLGTTTVQAGGVWTLSGLSDGTGTGSNTPYPALYAGGVLTATATEAGKLPSQPSNAVTVGCANLASKTLTPQAICAGSTAIYTLTNVEPGVVYTLQDASSGSDVATGVSRLGTGTGTSSLTLTSGVFNTAGTYQLKVNTFSVGATNCSMSSAAVPLTVNPQPLNRTTTATTNPLPTGVNSTTITVAATETGTSYQLVNVSASPNANVGAPQTGNGGTLTFGTGTVPGTTTFAVRAVSVPGCAREVGQVTLTRSGPLPVELVAFEAQAQTGGTLLTWRTAQEKNNDHFDVQRSADGREFVTVATVAGQGTSTAPREYRALDAGSRAAGRVLYYRLRQVDQDGTSSLSAIRVVTFGEAAALTLHPNPTSGAVQLDLGPLPAGPYAVRVSTPAGRVLCEQQLAGGQRHELRLQALPAGVYLVRVQSATLLRTVRLVKVN